MNFKRLLNTYHGQVILSIVLALGLASLFRKVCTDKNCINFDGPILSELTGKVYKHGDKCYKYSAHTDKCDKTKKIVNVSGEPIPKT